MTTADYLNQLEQDREDLVDNLEEKGITGLTGDETFTELVPEVLNISGGGGSELDWTTLGYNEMPETINEDFNYSTYVKNNWNGTTSFDGDNKIVYLPLMDFSNISDATSFFRNCQKLQTIPNINVTLSSTQNMFSGCTSLRIIDVSNFNITNVERMDNMFTNCSSLKELDFSNLNNSNVKRTSSMFSYCSSLKKVNLKNISTPNLIRVQNMFSGCTALEEIDIRNFDFSNVGNYYTDMFANVPTNCLIIVKDTTQKTWMNTKFPSMTNVQTVSEYEAS